MNKVIASILVALALTGCGMITYSDGDRAGVVTKLSHKGLPWCKTWEGELLMGGFNTTTKGVTQSNVFYFSVTDKEIVPKIKQKMETGERSVLHYEQVLFPWSCSQKTDYVVVGVE